MHFRIQVVAVSDDGTEQRKDVADLVRSEATLETLGLTLEESKQLLQALQRMMIEQQAEAYLDAQRACPACGKQRQIKQRGTAPFRTLFWPGLSAESALAAVRLPDAPAQDFSTAQGAAARTE